MSPIDPSVGGHPKKNTRIQSWNLGLVHVYLLGQTCYELGSPLQVVCAQSIDPRSLIVEKEMEILNDEKLVKFSVWFPGGHISTGIAIKYVHRGPYLCNARSYAGIPS